MNKLSAHGIKDKGMILIWNDFAVIFSTEKNYVCVNKSTSSAEAVYCGVPQGSILGPLLFSVYINDLRDYIEHSSVLMYADYTMLFVSSESKEEIESNLNHDIQNLIFP